MVDLGNKRRGRALPAMLRSCGITDPTILDIFAQVSRKKFLSAGIEKRSLDNAALPIGHGQTTTQPEVIARMLELVWQPNQAERVLEIGCGCGYQSALLSLLYKQVIAIDRIRPLAINSASRLRTLGYNNVRVMHADGKLGCKESAPFDAVIVCAGTIKMPEQLAEQLAEGGKLVIPEQSGDCEELAVYTKQDELVRSSHDQVMFVPLLAGLES